jgi:hypothetical protein
MFVTGACATLDTAAMFPDKMTMLNRGHLAAGAMLLFPALFPASTAAHEHRDVAGSKYACVVGFLIEPAFDGFPNGVSVRIATKSDGKPVEGAEKSLKVEVRKGSETKMATLRPVHGKPGSYAADFLPAQPGAYTFVFSGTLGDDPFEASFESGPGRFGDVLPSADLVFPRAESSEKRRLTAVDLQEIQTSLRGALERAADADARARRALTLSFLGGGFGVVGMLLGLIAMIKKSRSPT